MKKVILFSIFAIMAIGVKAQDSTALFQNFNECDSDASGNHFPPGWSAYSTNGDQRWKCYDIYGTSNSPCLQINGYTGGIDNQDTDWLFTPVLDFHLDTAIYLNCYVEYAFAGDSLHIMVSNNYRPGSTPDSAGITWTELHHSGSMISDSSYNTDLFFPTQVNLTPYKSTPCVVGFRYSSSIANGSRWDIDSVFTTASGTAPVNGVANISPEKFSLNVIGNSTPGEVKVEFDVPEGNYNLEVFDMVGRRLYDENLAAHVGYQTYTISNINLKGGMYIVKLSNANSFGVTKAVVQ